MAETPQQPTAEDQAKATEVATAAATAATGESTEQGARDAAARAARETADKVDLKLTDEQIEQIAAMSASMTIRNMEERGAFDPPPEPVAPPEAGAPAAAPHVPETAAPAGAEQPAPQRRNFAQRFLGD